MTYTVQILHLWYTKVKSYLPKLIAHLRVAKKKMTITPGTQGFIGGKVHGISKVDEKTQSMYRSGVGTLLYLTKHNRPDITNPVRELSKSMDGANRKCFKRTLSRLLAVALRMYLTLHLLLFAQSM